MGFRFFIHRKACGDGQITGWTKNADGYVEALLEGERDLLERCVKACRLGPPFAKVTKVDVSWEKPTGEFTFFEVI